MSGEANGLTVDLAAAIDPDHVGDVGVPASTELLAFANAVERSDGDIDQTRAAVAAVIGADGAIEAAAIIAIFNGLVRVADGTGIRLDDGVFAVSAAARERLGLNDFVGAANSADVEVGAAAGGTGVEQLFG